MKALQNHLYLLTGFALGLALGLGFAWGIAPAEHSPTTPASLRADFKDEYRLAIASAFRLSGDLGRARARLNTLEESDPAQALNSQAQRTTGEESLALAEFAQALAAAPTPTVIAAPTLPPSPTDFPTLAAQASPSPTPPQPSLTPPTRPSPLPSPTPRPSPIPSATPGVPYQLTSQNITCNPLQPGLLKITLRNSAGLPAAGEQITLTWLGGEENIFTGFKPEKGAGYADFVMNAETEYALSLPASNTRLSGLLAPACTDENGQTYPGGITLEFSQP